jgi:hypothetical protein
MSNNYTSDSAEEPFKVFVRIRPILENEINNYEKTNPDQEIRNILTQEENCLHVTDPYSYEYNVKVIM